MKLLIAGFGDLGATLAQACGAIPNWEQAEIIAIRRSPPEKNALENVSWVKADLSDPASLPVVATQANSITHVVYCAAPSERTEAAYRATYLTGLKNLVTVLSVSESVSTNGQQTSPHRPQFLFVSSTAVYDNQTQGLFDENSPTEPRRFNGQILLEAEQWLLKHWPDALVLRLSGIYGPSKQGLLASIAKGAATVPDSRDFVANRIHIEDAARAILHLFDHNEHGLFIGTDSQPMPLADLYLQLAKMLNAPTPGTGAPSPMMGKKKLSNQKLLSTGFEFKWPDCLQGYQAIIAAQPQR